MTTPAALGLPKAQRPARPPTPVLAPGPLHAGIFGRLPRLTGTGGKRKTDPHIAAIAIGRPVRCRAESPSRPLFF